MSTAPLASVQPHANRVGTMRPGIQARPGQTARCANSWPSARPQYAQHSTHSTARTAQQLRARHVPALPGMPISDAVHIPSSPRPRSPYCDGAQSSSCAKSESLAGMRCWEPARCKTPHAPIYEAKPALLHRGRPFFSSGSSLSGYASAATGSPGQDVNDPEAGRQHSQSRCPDQGSSPGAHKERGLAAPDFLGDVFFCSCSCCPPLFVCSDLFVGSGQ
jgi:hypothetical protein